MTSSKSVRLRIMRGDVIAFGPGKAALLTAIAKTGSISAAARTLAMSYRRAWLLVEEMNTSFHAPLVTTATGGANGGGAQLTELAYSLARRYEQMQVRAEVALAPDMLYFDALMVPNFQPVIDE